MPWLNLGLAISKFANMESAEHLDVIVTCKLQQVKVSH